MNERQITLLHLPKLELGLNQSSPTSTPAEDNYPRRVGIQPMSRPQLYPPGARALQADFETTALADRLEERTVSDALEEWHVKTIERATFFFLATVDVDGWPDVSYKGGAPGFVAVIDARPSSRGRGQVCRL